MHRISVDESLIFRRYVMYDETSLHFLTEHDILSKKKTSVFGCTALDSEDCCPLTVQELIRFFREI